MSAKQVSSGYILWKTGAEPVRHIHSGERPAFDCRPSSGMVKSHTGGVSSGRGIRRRRQYGENRLPQPVPIPKKRLENSAEKAGLFQLVSIQRKFPGIVWKRSGCPGGACTKGIPGDSVEKFRLPRQTCSEEIAGTGQTGGISPEAPAWGQQPADTRTEKHPEGHRAFRVFCYAREITSSGRFRTIAGSPSDGAAGAGACPTGTAHGFRP